MTVYWIAIVLGLIFLALLVSASSWETEARRSGLIPPEGQATMADVERLVKADLKIHAIKCYREIHKCGLAEAKKAVEALQLQQNNKTEAF